MLSHATGERREVWRGLYALRCCYIDSGGRGESDFRQVQSVVEEAFVAPLMHELVDGAVELRLPWVMDPASCAPACGKLGMAACGQVILDVHRLYQWY